MKRLFAALLIPVLLAVGLVVATPAHAAGVVWFVNYGNAFTNNSPNMWSNRNPTWQVGTNPSMTAQTDGNLVIRATFCPAGVCWASNTSYHGPAPWQFFWDSRYATFGAFRIYSSEGAIRFDTHTSGWLKAKMVFFDNGCLNVYGGDYGSWGAPIWTASSNPACAISL